MRNRAWDFSKVLSISRLRNTPIALLRRIRPVWTGTLLLTYGLWTWPALKHILCREVAKVCFKRGHGVGLKHAFVSAGMKTCFNETMPGNNWPDYRSTQFFGRGPSKLLEGATISSVCIFDGERVRQLYKTEG